MNRGIVAACFLMSTCCISGEAQAESCTSVINDLISYTQASCGGRCKNIVSYQMSVMNNDKFVGYSSGNLEYNSNNSYFYTDSAETFFSDRRWKADCTPRPGYICLDKQPFNYHRTENIAFKIKKTGVLTLDFNSWNEHYTISLSCQNGYMYGFQPGKLMIMLYPKKGTQEILY